MTEEGGNLIVWKIRNESQGRKNKAKNRKEKKFMNLNFLTILETVVGYRIDQNIIKLVLYVVYQLKIKFPQTVLLI